MIITVIGKRKDGGDRLTLEPEAPFEWICDTAKTTFSDLVYLGKTDSVENWRDATEEEYQRWKREQEQPPEPEDEATEADYQQALQKLGVDLT